MLPKDEFSATAISADLKWMLFTIGLNPSVYLLEIGTGKVVAQGLLDHGALGIHGFSHDNRYAVISSWEPSTVFVFKMPKEVWNPGN